MTTQLMVIGDIHLRSGHPRHAARLRGFDQAIEAGMRLERLGAWVVLGDVFDTTSTVQDRNQVAERFILMASRAPVLVPRGNHDGTGDLAIFGRLGTAWPVLVREYADVVTFMLATGQLATASVLPWPSAAGLVAKGVAPGDIQQAARAALDSIFMHHGAALESARALGSVTFFAGHATAVGSIASTGQPQGDQGIAIDAAMLARLGDCPKLLGHIHRAQDIAGATYAGSVSPNDAGELEQKRAIVVTFDDGGTYTIASHPLESTAIWHVEAEYRDGALTWRVTKGPDGEPLEPPSSWAGCEVRVRVRFAQSEKSFFDAAKDGLFTNFKTAAKFALDPVCVPDRAVRAPEVAAAHTPREKVQAWATVTQTPVADDVLSALDRLTSTPADVLLAQVQQEVDALVAPQAEQAEAAA